MWRNIRSCGKPSINSLTGTVWQEQLRSSLGT